MDNQKTGATDEIDLGQLLIKLGNAIKNALMAGLRFIALLRRIPIENKLSFAGIITVSIILAIGYSLTLKKNYYESTMILTALNLNKRLVDNAIEKLDQLSQEDDKTVLAKLLHIPDTTADNIIGFESRPFVSEESLIEVEILREQLRAALVDAPNPAVIEQVVNQIEIENKHVFEITVRILNPAIIGQLQDALVSYFRNNDFVKRRLDITQANRLEKKQKLLGDLEKLDSLKSIIYTNYKSLSEQSRAGSNNVILSDRAVTDPIEVYTQDFKIYEKLQDINRDIYLQGEFELVDGFTEFTEPASPSIFKVILISIALGIVVAYLDVAVRKFNQYLSTLG